MISSGPSLRQITASAVALACGSLLALGGGIAQADYIKTGEFHIGEDAKGLAVDQSSGSSGDVYAAEEKAFGFAPDAEVSQFNPFSTPTAFERSETFGNGSSFSGVAVDPSTGKVYALDSEHAVVDEFDPAAGTGSEPIATIGAGTIATGDNARIWVDAFGDVFVPDNVANVVYEFTPTAPNSNIYTGAPTVIASGALHEPTAVAVDSNGNAYVVDAVVAGGTTGRVQEFSSTGALEGVLGEGVLSSAQGLTVNSMTNEVIVIDNHEGEKRVDAFEPSLEKSPGTFSPGNLHLKSAPGQFPPEAFFGIGVVPASGDVYVATYGVFGGKTALILVPFEGPKAETRSCQAVTATGATLNGTVNPNSFDTHWYFEYGLTKTYGQDSPAFPGEDAGAEPGARSVTTTLSGLQPNKTYHYQLIAQNLNGTAEGGDQTCTTPTARPSVDGESSSAVTLTGATLDAQVNPNNQATTYQFQYGTDIGYSLGNVPATPVSVGEGYGDAPDSAALSGLQPNTLYHYRVIAVNTTGTTDGVDHTFTTLPNAPSATTGTASGVGQSTATLNGTIDPQGAETSYYFEYSGPGTLSIISGQAGSGSGAVTVTAAVNGLSPGSTYRYRLIATNAGGTTIGTYQTFTTAPSPPAGPPAVITGGTSNLTPGSVTLSGSVNPSGGTTSYQFQYGTSVAYGASLPEASAGSGTEPQGIAAGLSGLVPGTPYHYRLVAANAAGTTYGADQMFTTPAAPVSVFGPSPTNTIATITTTKPAPPKPLTRVEKLAKALKACKKDKRKAKRAKCEKEARRKYGPKAKRKKR